MTSKQLIRSYRILNFWRTGLWRALYAHMRWFTPEQRAKLYEADRLIDEAEMKIREVFEPEIGKMITYEIRRDA